MAMISNSIIAQNESTERVVLKVENQGEPENIIENVSVKEFKALIEKGNGILIDVRTPGEISEGYISGASMINYYDENIDDLTKLFAENDEIYVYCQSGYRAGETAELLAKNGTKKVYNLEGGFSEWQEVGLPYVVPASSEGSLKELYLYDLEQALQGHKYVMAYFQPNWFSSVKDISNLIEKAGNDYQNKLNIIGLNSKAGEDIQELYHLSDLPEIILFDNGQMIWRHRGFITSDELNKVIKNKVGL